MNCLSIHSCARDLCLLYLIKHQQLPPCWVQGADNQKYEPVTDQARLLTCIEGYLTEYNQQNKTRMDLVLFLYAAEHICRISRIIKQPFGNALLVSLCTLLKCFMKPSRLC